MNASSAGLRVWPLILWVLLLSVPFEQVQALDLKRTYLDGLQDYKRTDFLNCAIKMESLKEDLARFVVPVRSKINLYRAYCNYHLGYRLHSAGLMDAITFGDLSASERELYRYLQKVLAPELDAKNKIDLWATFYGGATAFRPVQSKESAALYGVALAFVSARGWDFALGGEYLDLTLNTAEPEYTQTQVNAAFGDTFFQMVPARLFVTSVTTSNTESEGGGNEGRVVGLMLGFVPTPGMQFALEYDYSRYPSLAIGATTVGQLNVSWDQTLWQDPNALLAMRLLYQTVAPKSAEGVDPSSGLVMASRYNRTAFELALYLAKWRLGGSGWTGSELLGVRNFGSVVYNAIEQHNSGYSGWLSFDFDSSTSVKISYGVEELEVGDGPYNASTWVAALTYKF